MAKISNLLYFLCFAFGCQIAPGYASDLEKEKRWSQQIVDALLVGEAVQLDADGTAFLGIYTEASEGAGDRAVILLHGIGAHPDWPEITNPLRSELPEHGWSSLLLLPSAASASTSTALGLGRAPLYLIQIT